MACFLDPDDGVEARPEDPDAERARLHSLWAHQIAGHYRKGTHETVEKP